MTSTSRGGRRAPIHPLSISLAVPYPRRFGEAVIRHFHRDPAEANLASCHCALVAEVRVKRIQAESQIAPYVVSYAIRKVANELPSAVRSVDEYGCGQQPTPLELVLIANDEPDVEVAHGVEEAGQIAPDLDVGVDHG